MDGGVGLMMHVLKAEHADKEVRIAGSDRFTLRRHCEGYAYPVSGNAHNPTPRFGWLLLLDGKVVDHGSTARELREAAREYGVDGYLA